MNKDQQITTEVLSSLLNVLKTRFETNTSRHPDISWNEIENTLRNSLNLVNAVKTMEHSGGEPDVIKLEKQLCFVDCSPESPAGRRSLCYDRKAWESRKDARPTSTAIDEADAMGVTLLNEAEYMYLQTLGEFDLKTSSWLLTSIELRELGGAIFGDRRYGRVFVYHNGAQSYYAARGFRAKVVIINI